MWYIKSCCDNLLKVLVNELCLKSGYDIKSVCSVQFCKIGTVVHSVPKVWKSCSIVLFQAIKFPHRLGAKWNIKTINLTMIQLSISFPVRLFPLLTSIYVKSFVYSLSKTSWRSPVIFQLFRLRESVTQAPFTPTSLALDWISRIYSHLGLFDPFSQFGSGRWRASANLSWADCNAWAYSKNAALW